MLFSDFAAAGGVLGVALIDLVHPLLGPDLPQPTPSKLVGNPFNTMPSAMGPDFPQPPPTQFTALLLSGSSNNLIPPDPPQPLPPKLMTIQGNIIANFILPDFPQPPQK